MRGVNSLKPMSGLLGFLVAISMTLVGLSLRHFAGLQACFELGLYAVKEICLKHLVGSRTRLPRQVHTAAVMFYILFNTISSQLLRTD
jgi:hypothetical protein